MAKLLVDFLFNNVIGPIVVAIIPTIIASVSFKVSTGHWIEWIRDISPKTWLLLATLWIFWISFIMVRRRILRLRELNASSSLSGIWVPVYGWMEIGEMGYSGVLWKVKVHAASPWELNPSIPSPESIEIKTPPLCPKCGTELEQRHGFFGGYRWTCVGCNFNKKNKDSYYREAERARKLAKRKYEKLLEENSTAR